MGVAGGQIETAGRFFELSEEESERMDDKTNASRAALSAHTKTPFWACTRSSLRPRTSTRVSPAPAPAPSHERPFHPILAGRMI